MRGMPQACTSRDATCIQGINSCNGLLARKRRFLTVHRIHKLKQHGLSGFTATEARRLCQRSLGCRIAAASSNSMTQEQLGDTDLSQFVDLADELAELAGSITKRFFRYGIHPSTYATCPQQGWLSSSTSGQMSQHTDTNYCCCYRQPLTIDNKADKSPVTEADRQAEHAMREKIAERFPHHGIFGEEEGMKQPRDTDTQYLWVLDPIDGTKSFITGKYVGLNVRPCRANCKPHPLLGAACKLRNKLVVMRRRQTCFWHPDRAFAQWRPSAGSD